MDRTTRLASVLVLLLCAYGLSECISATAAAIAGEAEGLFRYPLWGLVHFGSAAAFATLVPMQVWRGFRDRYPGLHRLGGRLAFAAALVMVTSGLALSFAMPERPLPVRVFFTVIFVVFVTFGALAFKAVRARDFDTHRQWTARMAATALGALTHRLVFPFFLVQGFKNGDEFWSLFVTAGWVAWAANLAATEWWLARTPWPTRKPRARGVSTVSTARSPLGAA